MARDRIANSRYCQKNGWVAGIVLGFLTQVTDMRLDQAGIPVVAKAPNMCHNLIHCTDRIGIHGQEVEQLALRGCQAHHFAIDRDLTMELWSTSTRIGPTVTSEDGRCNSVELPLRLIARIRARN